MRKPTRVKLKDLEQEEKTNTSIQNDQKDIDHEIKKITTVDELVKEIDKQTDFEINTIIDIGINYHKYEKIGIEKIPSFIITGSIIVWKNRHPLTLPPCFAEILEMSEMFDRSIIYKWPMA